MNILEKIQINLGFNTLEKIDPNTQETSGDRPFAGSNALTQAGIPAILLGIYNHLEQEPDLETLSKEHSANWMERIFGKNAVFVTRRINEYARFPNEHSDQQLEHIAAESVRVLKENIGLNPSESEIRNFITKNKPDTLLYLPPSLEMGTLMHNNNLDDRTAKMEGPISNLMHQVEKTFNSSNGQ